MRNRPIDSRGEPGGQRPPGVRTHLLGRLDLDEARLRADLARGAELPYAEHYSEFLCGRAWKSCVLWAPGGAAGDGVISRYDATAASAVTAHGARLPYLRELVERTFALDRLVLARLAVMSQSVGIPHRDYLELAGRPAPRRASCRVHVPLATDEACYFTEDNVVYRMRPGEVWLLDASRIHGSAVLSDLRRVHLLLDFTAPEDAARLVRFPVDAPPRIPEASLCHRAPLSERERRELLALAPLLDLDNLRDAIAIVVKKHYRRDGGEGFVWSTLHELARLRGGDAAGAAIGDRIRDLHRYYTLEREDS